MRSQVLLVALAITTSAPYSTAAVEPLLQRPLQASLTDKLKSAEAPTYTNELFKLHRNLVEIESISGNEYNVGNWLVSHLQHEGYTVETQEVSKDRFNVLAHFGNRHTKILLTSHIDTVPPFYPYGTHHNASSNTTTIFGRGSVDDKASVAAQITAVNNLVSSDRVPKSALSLLFVVGEETGGDGMRAANELHLVPDTVIFGEPTEGKLADGHKGNLGFTLHAKGKAAHSGYPWLGRSANEVLVKALAALMQVAEHLPSSEKYGSTTVNLGRIEGGVAANVVAETASAKIAVRLAAGTPAESRVKITDALRAAVAEYEQDAGEEVLEIEWSSEGYGPVGIDADVTGFETITVNYGTDIPNFKNFAGKKQKRYLYGPGSILVAHSDHEALVLEELVQAVEDYERLVLHSLAK
ncbi:hypothetical protein LTR66_000406 [Elasticomyces elasticus]|nr:hypothetical protein LTR50_005965 [Elasticomyces elasticus]KAK5000775.1 hypothetical protein LTR66_000406 [Elasticomyces elasticus]